MNNDILDSDCELLEERDISTITIPDSPDDEPVHKQHKMKCMVQNGLPDFEDGELMDEEPVLKVNGNKVLPNAGHGGPVFEIIFYAPNAYNSLGDTVLQALQTALNTKNPGSMYDFTIAEGDNRRVAIQAYACSLSTEDSLKPTKADKADKTSVDSKAREDSPDLDISSLFTLDTKPSTQLDTCMVPSYKRGDKNVLDEAAELAKKSEINLDDKCERPKMATTCFNCGVNDHPLRECPKPRNLKRIANARAKKARDAKTERYHNEADKRFAHIQPGKLSRKLKDALRLRRGEVPFYIYRMRTVGYPPGWLEEAKLTSSGISLFDTDSDVAKASERDKEWADKIDASKIIDYPGFNVDPGDEYHDDYRFYNAPALTHKFMKSQFISALGDRVVKNLGRRKPKPSPTASTKPDEESVREEGHSKHASDVDKVESPMEDDAPSTCEQTIAPLDNSGGREENSLMACNEARERSASPTLAELQAKQEQLLREIGAVASPSLSLSKVNCIDLTSSPTQSESLPKNAKLSEDEDSKIRRLDIDEDDPMLPTTPTNNKTRNVIKESQMGTPVLQFSPYEKLPAGENFKVGVSDVINFENLPDSTGAYEKMRVVLKDVRKTILKYNDETDNSFCKSKDPSTASRPR